MSIICGINSSHLCPVAPCGFCQFLRVEASCFQKRWLAGEKDACESCSLAGPTVLALGCLVLAKQFDARMGRFQPPVPQVLAPELIQSSLTSWQFDSNQFQCPLHLPRLLALYSLQCQEEEERRLGDRISCGKTAVETLRLFTCQTEMDAFLKSEQAQFWAEAGFPFSPLTADECRYLMLLGNCIGHDNYGVSLCENGFAWLLFVTADHNVKSFCRSW